MKDLTTELTKQHSKPECQFSVKLVAQKFYVRNKIYYIDIQGTEFKTQVRIRNS